MSALGLASGFAQGMELGNSIIDRVDRLDELRQRRDERAATAEYQRRKLLQDAAEAEQRMGLERSKVTSQAEQARLSSQERLAAQRNRAEQARLSAEERMAAQRSRAEQARLSAEERMAAQQNRAADLRLKQGEHQMKEREQRSKLYWEGVDRAKQRVPLIMDRLKKEGPDPATAEDDLKTLALALGGENNVRGMTDESVPRMAGVLAKVKAGKLDMNAPESLDAINYFFRGRVNMGVGEVHDNGQGIAGKVLDKRVVQVVPDQADGNLLHFVVRTQVQTPGGQVKEYDAPLTRHRTSDPDDPALGIHIGAINNQILGLMKFQDLLWNDPDLEKKYTDMVRLGSKGAKPEDAEMRSAKLRDINARADSNEADARFKQGLANDMDKENPGGAARPSGVAPADFRATPKGKALLQHIIGAP